MKRLIQLSRLLAAILIGAGVTALAMPAAQAQSHATVSILHAVPGATVDAYANGDSLLTDFEPGTLTDPQELPAGTYDLKVVEAGAGADAEAVAELQGAEVPAGANITVVAHLDADGNPTLSAFVNDMSSIPAGESRLVVRHTAAAPAVDVRAAEEPIFTDLTNPNEAMTTVPAGTVSADVTLAGTDEVAIGPADLELGEGMTTIVYAWGSAEDGNLDLAVQTISGMHQGPSGVPGGTGGQAAATTPVWVIGAILLGGVGLAITVLRVRRTQVAPRP